MMTELEIARLAAIEAGGIISSFYKSNYQIKEKGYKNLVTTADQKSDECLKKVFNGSKASIWMAI